MLHEYVIQTTLNQVDTDIEKLNVENIFNVFYETPIETIQTDNGYSYHEKEEEKVDLKIYAEENEMEGLPYSLHAKIAKILGITVDEITYQKISSDFDYTPDFEDITMENGWKLTYIKEEKRIRQEMEILFDPQGAFGTGLHGTTRDCLTMILNTDFTDKAAADLGTGSGILSIAAKLKGATYVDAFDIEDVNRQVQHNATVNDITQLNVFQKDLLHGSSQLEDKYDIIFINIGADETIQIMNKHHLTESKCDMFLLSGLVEWNIHTVISFMEEKGFILTGKRQSEEWVTGLFKRKNINK